MVKGQISACPPHALALRGKDGGNNKKWGKKWN
jgi:hypothetical protein